MKQNPSQLKYKKNHKAKNSFFSIKDNKNSFLIKGFFALKALEYGKLTFKQIEAGRKSIRRNIKKKGNLSIMVFTNRSVTSKPLATRMGKGKGTHSFWMCTIKAGQIIYEISGVNTISSIKALQKASNKMPFKTKIVKLLF